MSRQSFFKAPVGEEVLSSKTRFTVQGREVEASLLENMDTQRWFFRITVEGGGFIELAFSDGQKACDLSRVIENPAHLEEEAVLKNLLGVLNQWRGVEEEGDVDEHATIAQMIGVLKTGVIPKPADPDSDSDDAASNVRPSLRG